LVPSPRFLSLLLGLSAVQVASAVGFDTPEDAVQALEQAYIHKNADAAVAAKDFVEEARLMLQKMNPSLANDADILKQTTEVLELAFRNELRTKGYPNFVSLKCSFVSKTQIYPTLVKLTEQCVFPDSGKSVEDVFVTKRGGWRVVVMPSAS
jgi:hypothetical protein